jgi:hypothetical protein
MHYRRTNIKGSTYLFALAWRFIDANESADVAKAGQGMVKVNKEVGLRKLSPYRVHTISLPTDPIDVQKNW